MKQNKKVVLAFSGGLDTSYCVKYLIKEKQLEVHTVTVNTGGFSKNELAAIEKNAYQLGSTSHTTLEETESYYEQIIKYLIFGNVLKNDTYPLSVSAERIHQAIAIAQYAKKLGVEYIAHGSTGAGNDQVRFDLVFQLIAKEVKIITPIRDQQLTRKQEVEYLAHYGINKDWKQAQYSINKGLWGTSVGGAETLTSHKPLPESAYPNQIQATSPEKVTLSFEKGEICGINGENLDPVTAIQKLESMATRYAIGRDMHIGDTIIGIKGRIGFEAAAAIIIIKAHHTLEKHTLTKWQLYWKKQLAEWYGMLIHEAQYFDPSMRDIEVFLTSTQQKVSGEVMVELLPYRFIIEGVKTPNDLMSADFGQYGEFNSQWSSEDVKGFTKIMANAFQIYNHVNQPQ